jgi:hypothetical protein
MTQEEILARIRWINEMLKRLERQKPETTPTRH